MKIIYRFLIVSFLILSVSVIYLSIFGIETTKFNKQISTLVKDLNKDLEIKLKKVNIILDPIKFQINAKTIGPQLKINEKTLEIETIKTKISIGSILNNNFSLKNLDISTKSLEIKKLISFIRNFKNTPELYLLEKVVKNGYLITDINLEFDEKGKLKENFVLKGIIKDAQISLIKEYNLNKINFAFNLRKDGFELNDAKFSLNNILLSSKNIKVKSDKKFFYIEGIVDNKNITLNDKNIQNLIKPYIPKINLSDVNFDSQNQFSFNINKRFKIDDLRLSSKIKLNKVKFENNLELKNYFPNSKKVINLNNHTININYKKKILSITGNGSIDVQDEKDKITYDIEKKDNQFKFDTNLIIEKNPLIINLLEYKKKPGVKCVINLKGTHFFDKETVIKLFSLKENENKFKIDNLILDKNFNINKFQKVDLKYLDTGLRRNNITITNKNNIYNLTGSKFNANNLIQNLIDDKNKKETKIFNKNFNLVVKIDQVYLDKDYAVNNLIGNINFNKNEISNAELNAFFSKDKKFKFTVKSNGQEKVSTLFLGQAEPIVKRYKFIKGYKGGSLDFYSSKKGDFSTSNLRIYNFKLKELPILTKLLTLASLQGIADILSGEGITFDEFEMNFNNKNDLITINEMYAIGPAISILMDGYIEKNKLISLRGSLVPATTINKFIGTIPVLGKILVGSKTGEGVFGVSFKIKGPPKNPETTVNPIKTLTPRFITRTLEKIKKN